MYLNNAKVLNCYQVIFWNSMYTHLHVCVCVRVFVWASPVDKDCGSAGNKRRSGPPSSEGDGKSCRAREPTGRVNITRVENKRPHYPDCCAPLRTIKQPPLLSGSCELTTCWHSSISRLSSVPAAVLAGLWWLHWAVWKSRQSLQWEEVLISNP